MSDEVRIPTGSNVGGGNSAWRINVISSRGVEMFRQAIGGDVGVRATYINEHGKLEKSLGCSFWLTEEGARELAQALIKQAENVSGGVNDPEMVRE